MWLEKERMNETNEATWFSIENIDEFDWDSI